MSAPSVIERVKTTLVALKMPRALEVLDVTLRGIERGEIGAVEAIDALLTEELTTRENRRVRMAVQMGPSAIKTLAGFDFAFQPSLDKKPHPGAGRAAVHRTRRSGSSIGPPGTGKTHLSLALGVEAVKAGRSVYFSSLADIVTTLAKAERDGALRRDPRPSPLRAAHRRRDRLPPGHAGRRHLLPARQRAVREGRGYTILTSNRGFAEWGEIFGDFVVATALLDRLLHHAVVIQIEGSSYRLREHAALLPETARFKPQATANPIPPTLRRRGRPPKNGGADRPTADRQPARLGNFAAPLLRKIAASLTPQGVDDDDLSLLVADRQGHRIR